MNCPKCDKPMRKVRWEITNGKDSKEYDHSTYECRDDDIWVTTEIPTTEKSEEKSAR